MDKYIEREKDFIEAIKKNRSSHLTQGCEDIYRQANFIHPLTMSKAQAIEKIAQSQAVFVGTLRVGNKVHLCKGRNGNIEIGTVETINDLTITLVEVVGLRNLSEVQTIDFS